MIQTLQPLAELILKLTDKQNRYRFDGARIEVITCVITNKPEKSILLIESIRGNSWLPPQEGVEPNEMFGDAALRCLNEECNLKLPEKKSDIPQMLNHRKDEFIGILDLPESRHGEREVVKNSQNTYYRNIIMRKKAYWSSIFIVASQDALKLTPNETEIVNLAWFSLD